jgi:hypothetical protein
MKKTILIALSAIVATSLHAEILVAGWDNFDNGAEPNAWSATQKDANTTVSLAATGSAKNWAQWTYQDQGASGDGTFGNLSTSVASADTNWADNDSNVSLNASDGSIVFTLTNDSGADRTMDGFYFDAIHKNTKSANAWSLTASGAISGSANGTISIATYMFNNSVTPGTETPAATRDHAVDLSGFTDAVWEAGQSIVLTLAFTGSAEQSTTAGGNELVLDNIAVTVIPEPATLGLLGAFGGGILFIRRRFMI